MCTSTKLEKGLTSRQIDDRVQEIVRQGLSVYEVNAELLRSLKPDVILTQSQCAVCAVTPADLEETLACWTGAAPILLSLAPDNLHDVWGDLRRVGEAVGASAEAELAIEGLQERLAWLADENNGASRAKVASIEWIDPLMAAGNWVPELVQIAGRAALRGAGPAFADARLGCARGRRSRCDHHDAVRLPDSGDAEAPRTALPARWMGRTGRRTGAARVCR